MRGLRRSSLRDIPPAGLDSPRNAYMFLPSSKQRSKAERAMAKSNSIQIKLVSTADTGYYYVTKKNPRKTTDKLELRKYDPVVRKHVPFKEAKIK